ncbi:MAG: beta-propeller fold lactonase family protein, partial [Planctomycetota bacterium]|nr:beta-propeller fold lactonase family protein [Planctomycetota bacterium]
MNIVEVSNGFGRLLPYVIPVADPATGLPTSQVVEIRTIDDLLNNPSTVLNPVKEPSFWPTTATNPGNNTGNHFVTVKFSRSIKVTSVLDPTAAGLSNNGLTGAISVVAYDPATGASTIVEGRGFINGSTYFGSGPTLESWVSKNGQNAVTPETVTRNGTDSNPGIGFPGTNDPTNGVIDGSFINAGSFINPNTFVFVVDTDGNLSTYETFPENQIIRVVIKGVEESTDPNTGVIGGVLSSDNRFLESGGVATSVVGIDSSAPKPLLDGAGGDAVTVPTDLSTDIPCDQEIRWSFDEACQPHTIGPIPGLVPPALSSEFTVEFLPPFHPTDPPPGQTVPLPYTAIPVSPFNFTEYRIVPVVNFPGSDPFGNRSIATVTYFHNAASDMFLNRDAASLDETAVSFTVGAECDGLVNVPVAPGAIIVASNGGGQTGGLRVIDLDGFGQGTGDPTHDTLNPFYNVSFDSNGNPIAGDVTKFPFNPNLEIAGLFPPLSADATTIAGGSRGVLTLSQNSSLETQLIGSEQVGTVIDMMLGHPLDVAFNNSTCLSGGVNICASATFQNHPLAGGYRTGNGISFAPHPNPPRITLAPACYSPVIQAEEPTQAGSGLNRLTLGNAFGTIGGNGPDGLLTGSMNYSGRNFYGPAPTQPTCPDFTMRQQIGHFLYVLDRSGDQLVVLNSNRMTVIDRIPVSSPRDLAMSPDLNTLAVTNNGPSTVTFIDTDPNSATFHQVVKTTQIFEELNNRQGLGPTEIVWQPDGEDLLVICERSGSLAIIDAGALSTRKVIPGVTNPRLLTVSDRDSTFGFSTGLYYAYLISSSGEMTIFESGPDGIQGIGFDDFIGAPILDGRSGFSNASAMMLDPSSNQHGVYVA